MDMVTGPSFYHEAGSAVTGGTGRRTRGASINVRRNRVAMLRPQNVSARLSAGKEVAERSASLRRRAAHDVKVNGKAIKAFR